MKKLVLLSVFTFITIVGWCQTITSLSENFDVHCVLSTDFPSGWYRTNPITSTIPYGEWTCTPPNGRPNLSGPTPGIQCTDTSAGAHHLDTAFLLTPLLDLHTYPTIFMQFDTKTTRINLGGQLSVIVGSDTSHPDGTGSTNITPSLTPLFTNGDSTNWVTHVADLTPFKSTPFYLIFRYTSTDTTGSIWFLDNFKTETYNITLNVPEPIKDYMQLSVSGFCNKGQISFSYSTELEGDYKLSLFDLVGKEVYSQQVFAKNGLSSYTISGLNLHSGMYFLKMGNGVIFGTAKVMIQ